MSSVTAFILLVNIEALAITPDIKANGSDSTVNNITDKLSVTVNFDVSSSTGQSADWWVVVTTTLAPPLDLLYYDLKSGWTPGLSITYQGPLVNLDTFEIFNITKSALLPPSGTYTFYFGVDLNMNGSIDFDQLVYDSVTVNIENQPLSLNQVKFWAYQIQDIAQSGAVDALVNSGYDMLVLDPTRTNWSSTDKDFDTKGMVDRLKKSKASDGIHRKLLIAYIDIGQAEDWRWYWTWSSTSGDECATPYPSDWPSYIVTCDPDGWTGNYPVAYWDPKWKDIVIYGENTGSDPSRDYTSIIDEVIIDGFDGIYLDWVEAFENSEIIAEAQKQGKDPEIEMINFIQEMRSYATLRNPNFIIIQQNGSNIVKEHPEIFSTVDAIAHEGIWYDGIATDDWTDPQGYDMTVSDSLTSNYIENLDKFLENGIPVFNIEYALNHSGTAYSLSYSKNYIPYCSRRSLGVLTTTHPPGN